MVVTNCQFCGDELIRRNKIEKSTCGLCKKARAKLSYNYKNKQKLKAVKETEHIYKNTIEYIQKHSYINCNRVYMKECITCNKPMYNVWKTRLYCGSKCQRLKL